MKSIAARTTAARCSIVIVAFAAAFAGCEAKKSSNPLSPSVAGPIPGVDISAPKLLEPAQGVKFKESQQPIKLLIENASSTGVRPLSYTFEVATDTGFTTKVFSRAGVAPGSGRTSVQLDRLDIGRGYFWRARAEDGANTGPYATAAFEIFPKPAINPPSAISPVNNQTTANGTPVLTVRNSTTAGPVGNMSYEFQIATDQAFTQLVSAGIVSETAGQTSISSAPLAGGRTYFWRARVTDGETTSAWMPTQSFQTPAAPPPPPPGPAPGPAPGGPCNSSNPLSIVQCERAKFGHMSSGQTVQFLRSTAASLTRNGISGAPFGLLRKSGGSNCGGFSCDIICAGQGGSQRQWDVLSDAEGAQSPTWNGPETVPHIRVDVCEIQ